jgi:heme oxygenase (biliverdin-IX-beta and delta-forming)
MPTAASTDLGVDSIDARATRLAHFSAPGLRERLRAGTAPAHSSLDRRLAALDLRRLPDYRAFLEASAAALLPLEAALVEAGVVDLFPDWALRTRRSAILDDLARVGGVARPLARPRRLTPDGLLGAMYVLESLRLDARVILAHVVQSDDPAVTQATAYLCRGTGEHLWQSFLATLACEAAVVDEAAVIEAAQRAFGLLDTAVARSCPARQARTVPAATVPA